MEFYFFVVNFVIALILIVVLFLKRNFDYWKIRNVPHLKPEIPFGNTKGLGVEYHTYLFMKKAYEELKPQGPFGGCYISLRPTAFINDLDLVRQVLVKDFSYFANRGSYYNLRDDPISGHISNLEDDAWKNIRSKLTPAFTIGKLKMMYDTIVTIADGLMETIDRETLTSGSLNIKEIMARFTTDVIGDTAFGLNCHSVNDKSAKFFEMSVKSMESFHFGKRLVYSKYKKIARMLRMKLTPTYVSDFYTKVVKSTIDHRNQNSGENRNDLMNLLMNMMKTDGLSLNQVTAQSFFYFVSGYETSSTTLVFCLYEMCANQQFQKKARESVEAVINHHDDHFTYDTIAEMTYLDQIIKETLRKWPPSASLQRVASRDFKIPNSKHFIEKDCAVMIPVYGIHHDPDIYPNPQVFDPDRFLPEEEAKRHPFAFLPFGEGPRVCPAIKFAMLEIKICLAKLLMKYHFALDTERTALPFKIMPTNFMMNPAGGIFVHFEPLHH